MAFKTTEDVLELAFIPNADVNAGEGITKVEHLPALIPAHSIDEASEAARAFAFNRWKENEGWYGHQAAIVPTTKHFYEAAFVTYNAGVVYTSEETEGGKVFTF